MARGRPGLVVARRIIGGGLGFVGLFVLCFGIGFSSLALIVVGVLLLAVAAATRLRTGLRRRPKEWVLGTGRVVEVSDDPPETGEHGRCQLRLTVDAPGMPADTVAVRDSRVPVVAWPYPGLEVPIEVAAHNIRDVRVLWTRQWAPFPSTAPAAEQSRWDEDPAWDSGPRWDDGPDNTLIDFDLDAPVVGDRSPGDRPWPDPRMDDVDSRSGVDATATADPDPEPGGDEDGPDGAQPLIVPRQRPRPRPSPRPRQGDGAEPGAGSEASAASVATVDPEPGGPVDDLIATYPSAHPGPSAAIHGVGVTLLVADLDRSVAFYRDRLGFYEVDGGDGNTVLASGETRLVLRSTQDLGRVNRRLVHLNLEVADIDSVYSELKTAGVKFTYPPRVVNRGTRLELWAAAFKDPDGHGVALSQWRNR